MEAQIINSPSSHLQKSAGLSMKKKVLFGILAAFLASIAYAFYLYFKPRPSVAGMSPEYTLMATELVEEYDTNEMTANSKYLGKVIEVSGVISEKIKDGKGGYTLTLQGADLAGVGCQFESNARESLHPLAEGQQVNIKGICTGVLMDVVLVDCVVIDNHKTE